jgi:hypothetical protein
MTNTQAQAESMTQTTHTGTKAYRLAREGAWQVEPFGPLLTLAQAQAYQADMALANCLVLIVNTRAV